MDKELWEVFVPTKHRVSNNPIRTVFHKAWDEKVRKITGGLTIHPPVKGQWVNPHDGILFIERMIPVKIACLPGQIDQILKMTTEYYDQIETFAYLVSERVKFYKNEKITPVSSK